jgi:hypothetical protein
MLRLEKNGKIIDLCLNDQCQRNPLLCICGTKILCQSNDDFTNCNSNNIQVYLSLK